MTADEKQTFLADLHVGVLGLNDPGRGPLTVPVWYDYEPGGELWFITGTKSRKGKLLRTGARVSLAAQTEIAPYVYVSVEGPITEIGPVALGQLESMAIRYLGREQGRAYAADSDTDGQILVRVQPERWLGVDYSKS
jgi:hypothetical protein